MIYRPNQNNAPTGLVVSQGGMSAWLGGLSGRWFGLA